MSETDPFIVHNADDDDDDEEVKRILLNLIHAQPLVPQEKIFL